MLVLVLVLRCGGERGRGHGGVGLSRGVDLETGSMSDMAMLRQQQPQAEFSCGLF